MLLFLTMYLCCVNNSTKNSSKFNTNNYLGNYSTDEICFTNINIPNYNTVLSKKSQNIEKLNYDVILNRELYLNNELTYFQYEYLNLEKSELDIIYSSIDYLLQQRSNNFTSLLHNVYVSSSFLDKFKKEDRLTFLGFYKLKFNEKDLLTIQLKRRNINSLFKTLRKLKSSCIPIIKSRLLLDIPLDKIYFYMFIIDFISKVIENIILDTKSLSIDYYYEYYVKIYNSYEQQLIDIVETIPLPSIIFKFIECVKPNTSLINFENSTLKKQLNVLKRDIDKFYSQVNSFLDALNQKSSVIIEIIENTKKRIKKFV